MKFLSAPWRWDFISKSDKIKGCIFCELQKERDEDSLICFRSKNSFVILNKYPYSSGHLMIVPYTHISSPGKLDSDTSSEIWSLMNRSIKILENGLNPQGFNIGMNIGEAAGAGIRDHVHLHIVPRWNGDSNFMGIIGETKVLSYKMDDIYNMVAKGFKG